MDVDLYKQALPFVSDGLHSLVLPGVKIPELQSRIILLLEAYFCNKEVNNILKQAAAKYPNSCFHRGFVPSALLASFKSAKGITPQAFIVTAQTLLKNAFEISADGSSLRRTIAFEQRSLSDVLLEKRALSSCCCLFDGIPVEAIEVDFISFITQKIGAVEKYMFGSRVFFQESKSCHVMFKDSQDMIKLLAASIPLVYEDSKLTIHASRFPTKQKFNPSTQHHQFDFNHPSLTSRDPRSQPIKQKGQQPVQAAGVLGFPLNRIIKFNLAQDPEAFGLLASSVQAIVRSEFEKLAPVAECIVKEGQLIGFVRFQKGVAKEVTEMTMRHGGIALGVLGDKVPISVLEGEEERLYYEVWKEKKRTETPSIANLAVKATQTVKSRRNLASKQKPRNKNVLSSATRSAVPQQKGKKRLAVDDDDEVGLGGSRDKSLRIDIKSKKIKIDDLEDLVASL
ncbi:UNVERIFIED_CONTAM: hypothetical protein HDU68_002575, partial [Siphonaria sp. JEL0065]